VTVGIKPLTWDDPAVTYIFLSMHAYVINLDSRPDRWADAQSLPFELERFPAIACDPGWLGLNQTMHALFTAKYTGQPMLVFEDDAIMVRDRGWFDVAVGELPDQWDMLMLGANITGDIVKHSDYLAKVLGAWTTHSVLYSAPFIERMIRELPGVDLVIDEYFRTVIHPEGRSFVVRPMVCYQRPGHSDIQNVHQDYTGVFETSNSRMMKVS
jgi:hypothetical protein